MKNGKSSNIILSVFTGIFLILAVYVIFRGSFFWESADTSYNRMPVLLRGICMLVSSAGLARVVRGMLPLQGTVLWTKIKPSDGEASLQESERQRKSLPWTAILFALIFIFQLIYVLCARTGIRYDSLKVYDEAIALFSQPGINAGDLNGYFAGYTNNLTITVITHLTLKILVKLHILDLTFKNGVIVLQIINIIYFDLALAGIYFLLKRYISDRAGIIFLITTLINPLTYVWLPFYYTATVSMPFGVWGIYLFLYVFDDRSGVALRRYAAAFFSGILFATGFNIRATIGIALIASLITLCFLKQKDIKITVIALVALIIGCLLTGLINNALTKKYMAFDPSDTAFPAVHWVMMGLNPTGVFTPADEDYTMSFATAAEKKEGDMKLLKERAKDLGPAGITKLYFKKLSDTFADGSGGYYSELSISRDYGFIWKWVYGTHRDFILLITQIMYLAALLSGSYLALSNIIKKKYNSAVFLITLFITGSFLFQMIWEAGTIYSIGTIPLMYFLLAAGTAETEKIKPDDDRAKMIKSIILPVLGAIAFIILTAAHIRGDYDNTDVSVDQFLFQADSFASLSGDKEISQTFKSDKCFDTVSVRIRNYDSIYNDSVYSLSLYDGNGNLIGEKDIYGKDVVDYEFFPLDLSSEEGVNDYEIRIKKLEGNNDLIFLYYDTGHVDVYPDGMMKGLTTGETADLAFQVYKRGTTK